MKLYMKLVRGMSSNSWTSLAYYILKEKGKPMHYKEITKEVLKTKKPKEKHQAILVEQQC